MSVTRVSTHVLVGLANPFLVCEECRQSVRYWHNPERCDCDEDFYNSPCKHKTGVVSLCPSWSPVDECMCFDRKNHDKM